MILQHWKSLVAVDPVDTGIAHSQFTRAASAEEKLMLAVLENAIEQFQEYALAEDPKGKALLQEVEDWLWDKDSDWFFSFESICEHLQLDPDYVRRGFIRWKEARRNGASTQFQRRQPPQRMKNLALPTS